VSDGPWSVAPSPNGNSLSDRLLDTLTDVAFVKRFASISSLSVRSPSLVCYIRMLTGIFPEQISNKRETYSFQGATGCAVMAFYRSRRRQYPAM
jgi:hypothetical protein